MNVTSDLAKHYLKFFETKTRDNGERYLTLDNNRPEALYEVVHYAHGDFFPDDHRYQYCYESLEVLADQGNYEHIEPDVYNTKLSAWLSSHLARADYVNQELEHNGSKDIWEILAGAQLLERCEVFGLVEEKMAQVIKELL